MGWKDRFTFRERHFVDHDVAGTKLRFFPNRVGLLHELAEVSKPVASAMAALFADRSADVGSTEKVMTQGDTIIRECSVQGASPEILKMRSQEREKAVNSLVDALSDPRNRLLVGRLLMDSLRDEFPYSADRPPAEVEEFLYGDRASYEGLDLPILSDLIGGWIKANARVFGKAGESVAALARERLGGAAASPSRPEASPSESQSPSDGSPSRTPSSPPSPSAST
jgi:hypothetical protein